MWQGFFTDACFFPLCMHDDTSWPDLVGMSCIEARTEIFKKYPGMTVICLNETDPMLLDDDFNRYIVSIDMEGMMTNVIFNRN